MMRTVSCFTFFFFFSSRRRHTRCYRDWSSDVCSSDLPDRRRRRKRLFRRFERKRPMELWQLDVTGGARLEDRRELKVVTGVDDHSRFCVLAVVVERATAQAVCRALSE